MGLSYIFGIKPCPLDILLSVSWVGVHIAVNAIKHSDRLNKTDSQME